MVPMATNNVDVKYIYDRLPKDLPTEWLIVFITFSSVYKVINTVSGLS